MSATVPRLTAHDLKAELASFHTHRHRVLDTAFFGTGSAEHIKVSVRGEEKLFRVVPVDCELRLREALCSRHEDEALVLLVDYTDRLPIDVEGRLARGGLIFISRERRLATLFGKRAVAPALLDGPLAEALLRDARPYQTAGDGTTLDEHTAWRAFLERAVGLSPLRDLSEELVVEHFAIEPTRATHPFADDQTLMDAACNYLSSAAGPIAALAFQAWLSGRGMDVAGLAFVTEPLAAWAADGYVQGFLEGELEKLGRKLDVQLLERFRVMVPALALRLGNQRELFERVLASAEARVREKPKLEPFFVESRYLRIGLRAAKRDLARALTEAIDKAGPDGRAGLLSADVQAVVHAQRRVRDHRLADTSSEAPVNERAVMALRLLAYLAAQPEREARWSGLTQLELARSLADHYATEGGFVDYARRCVRSAPSEDALDAAIARVVSSVDAVRDSLDERFAPALKRWNEDRKLGPLVPIEDVLEAQGLELLAQCPDAKLLILVMDGMAWHAAVEILLDLRDAHYGPLRFTPKQTASTKMPAAMIAALPTMTEVSRAALFAGKLLRPGEKTHTGKDPERLNAHRAFVKAFGDGPSLLLRTDAEDNAGHLTVEARALLRSKDRVVALVVNAVDDMLGAKPSFRPRYNRQTIKALEPILEEARAAHRAVLMVADHGHVNSDRQRELVKVDGADSPRFRELSETGSTDPRELVLSDANTYRQSAAARVALLYREADRYKDAHHLGEHGGASLGEVVTPAFLIGADDLFQIVGIEEERNDALQTIAWPIPSWWNLELPVDKVTHQPSVRLSKAAESAKKLRAIENQLTLGPSFEPSSEAVEIVPPEVTSSWNRRVSKVYAKESERRKADMKKVLPLLDILVEQGGFMSDEVLAGKLGQAQRNVGGLVAILGEFINVDGYDVVSYSATSKQVKLDLKLLSELFGENA
jgi:hypothetical protein